LPLSHRSLGGIAPHSGAIPPSIFLCCDQTEPKCSTKEASLESWNYLKKRLKQLNLSIARGGVYRTKANCFRICIHGPIAVVYPEGIWYHSCTPEVLEQIIQTGSVTRGWIGVEVQDLTPELADSFKLQQQRGVLIAGVIRGGPAEQAGVKPGDVLLEVQGKPVPDSSAMLNTVADTRPGEVATLTLLRNGSKVTVKLTIGKRPAVRSRRSPE